MKSLTLVVSIVFCVNASAKTETTWKEWYLYSSEGEAIGYFSEEMEKRPKDKEIAISQRWMEKESGGTETYIGAVATDDKDLTPVAFFSEKKSPVRAHSIDGKVKNGKVEITYKPVLPQGLNIRKTLQMSKGLFLSTFLPSYLARKNGAKGPHKFTAIVEDSQDGNFDPRPGTAEITSESRAFSGTACRKARISFNGMQSDWWFSAAGKLCELTIPAAGAKLTLSTEADAKAAYSGKK